MLEQKLRKKIIILNGNVKHMETKAKHLDILRRQYTQGLRVKKQYDLKRQVPAQVLATKNGGLDEHEKAALSDSGPECRPLTSVLCHSETKKSPSKEPPLAPEAQYDAQIVQTLKAKSEQYRRNIKFMFDYKENKSLFVHKANTLLTNFLLEDIYKEKNAILQAIRFIIASDFFEEKERGEQEKEKEQDQEKEKEQEQEQGLEPKPKPEHIGV